jgi:hypothetical protein
MFMDKAYDLAQWGDADMKLAAGRLCFSCSQ